MSEEQSTPETPKTWSSWFEKAQVQAKEIASKAQVYAEIAREAAIVKANEIRENYDIDSATTILMSSIGAAPQLDAASEPQPATPSKSKSITKINQLDLVYVTENVIAMAFPFDPKKPGNAEGGNDINAVATFLRKKHGGHFMVWNVSEEGYDYSLFGDQVLEYKFPGHPAPPLGLLFKICTSVESWLDADERNVAIVHCLTGKGRTAALVACILTWIGEFSSPMEALQYAAERRGISVEYLTIPSQRRYVQYFSNMLDGVKPRSEPLLLRRVIINSIPIFGDNAGGDANIGCCPYIQVMFYFSRNKIDAFLLRRLRLLLLLLLPLLLLLFVLRCMYAGYRVGAHSLGSPLRLISAKEASTTVQFQYALNCKH